jgi:hypothetical protein
MITEAERRFPARIRIGVPPEGLGRQLSAMTAWLDANCGAANWAMTAAGLRGVVNDALAIYFLDTALANAFVARWCLGYRVETDEGSFRLRRRTDAAHCGSSPPDAIAMSRAPRPRAPVRS